LSTKSIFLDFLKELWYIVLQMKDEAVSLRLVIFGSIRHSSFIHTLLNRLEGRGERRGVEPL
jgi:hypothetical protein